MCGSRKATAVFITSADCSTNGSCISPDPNSSPTVFMPGEQVLVDDVERRPTGLERLVEVVLEAVGLAVDDPALQPLAERQRGQLGGPGLRAVSLRRHAGEQVEQLLQRVVRRAPSASYTMS